MKTDCVGGLMETAMENIKSMVEVNTIIGDAVETPNGTVIIPVSKMCCGFASGGTHMETDEDGRINEFEVKRNPYELCIDRLR